MMMTLFIFLMGLIWGSFFNVCIYRMPLSKSVVTGRSSCTQCQAKIAWYDNIPVLSYLLLKGKCRQCKAPFSIQYPLIELATGLIFVSIYLYLGLNLYALWATVFCCNLFVISVIDFHHQIIPDELSLGGIVLGFLFTFFLPNISWIDSLIGILIGGGSFFLVAFLYEKIAKQEGLGGGDVKMLGMIGAWLGYKSILPVIVLSSTFGAIVGVVMMLAKRGQLRTAIPFGPFLALGAFLFLFWGPEIMTFLFPLF